jgi:uncharacterized protein HemX
MAEKEPTDEPSDEKKPDEKKPDEAKPGEKDSDAKKPAAKEGAKPPPKPASKKAAPKTPSSMEERMEGVQGWMAEIEKRQERNSRVGGVAVVLALLAAAGALYLGITNKQDAATKDDVDELTEKVDALGASVQQQTQDQLRGLNQRLGTLEQQITGLTERQRKVENQITTLGNRVTAAEADAAAAANAPPDTGTDTGQSNPGNNP